jgi:aspartyl-tRNA(Asn)/glutamyl-tRNA(Gln) amidotransferase subunit B
LNHALYDKFIDLLLLLQKGEINAKQAKVIFEKIYQTNENASDLIKKLGFEQITDELIISKYLTNYIKENQQMLLQYNDRPERIEKFFIGLLMRDTKGQANPNISIQILRKLIKNK